MSGRNFDPYKVDFSYDHNDPEDSQVLIAITGDSDSIKRSLYNIIDQIDKYGKPIQGTFFSDNIVSIITPVWKKSEY